MRHRKYVLMIVVFLAGMVWLYFGSSPRVELTAGEDSKAYVEAFSPDYETARAKFRGAASLAGAATEIHQIEAKGAKGEVLTIDVARVGSDSPKWTVVVSSGIHGVEGPFGSAVQVAWLRASHRSPRLTYGARRVRQVQSPGAAQRRYTGVRMVPASIRRPDRVDAEGKGPDSVPRDWRTYRLDCPPHQ